MTFQQKIEEILKKIPDSKRFLTVDELNDSSRQVAARHPHLAELFSFGHSRRGEEILGLKIGHGKHNALVFGLPHPNEPIGTMTMEHLIQSLVEDDELREELDYTWYIVKAWDTDGARLNEGWFKGPFTLFHYARNFFRPAGQEQVDWTFPIQHKNLSFDRSIPETLAMMKLIDETKPRFIYSLHNAGFGGVYWYLTEDIPEVYPAMKGAAARVGIPLSLGEPEAPFCEPFAPAIYKELGIRDHYDFLEKYGIEHPEKVIEVGTCSADYAKSRYGSFTMLTELPYFFNPKIHDLSESEILRSDAAKIRVKEEQQQEVFILSSLAKSEPFLQEDNPFLLALKAFTGRREDEEALLRMAAEDPDFQRYATVAEAFDSTTIARFYRLLSLGLLVRANEWQLRENLELDSEAKLALQEQADLALQELESQSSELELELEYEVIPIQKLVSIQLECGLIVAKHLLL